MAKFIIDTPETLKNKKDLDIMNKLWDVNKAGIENGLIMLDHHRNISNQLTQFLKNDLIKGNLIVNLQVLTGNFKSWLNETSILTIQMSNQIGILKQTFEEWDKLHNEDECQDLYNVARSHMIKTTLNPLSDLYLNVNNDITNIKSTLYNTIIKLITDVIALNSENHEVILLLNLVKLELDNLIIIH